jgi:UDP-4-amino-4,6-dideoxy-N-acetyl-beta-L-altrosamine N-acetyltransferase
MYKLKPMSYEDLDLVLTWRNSPRVRENMYTNHVITTEEHQRWFEKASRDPSKRLLMCVDESNIAVGVVSFSDIDPVHKRATWAFYSGESSRRGVGSEMERLALDFAFENLGLEKLNCEVLSFNMPVVDFHRKYGFRVEGIFRGQYSRDGVVHDVFRLAHFRRDWLEQVRPAMARTQGSRAPTFKPGDSHREQIRFTRDLISQFAEVSEDKNPMYLRESATCDTEMQGPMASPMHIAAVLARILGTAFPGPGTVCLGQSLQFLHPIYPDTQIEYLLRIASRVGRQAILTVRVSDRDDKVATTGEVEVLLPKTEVH